jgi:hypothetical protein
VIGDQTSSPAVAHARSGGPVFSFPEETSGWPRLFVRHVMRLPRLFGISFFYRRLIIGDKLAFERSMRTLLNLDFERMIVGTGNHLRQTPNAVEQALTEAGIDH